MKHTLLALTLSLVLLLTPFPAAAQTLPELQLQYQRALQTLIDFLLQRVAELQAQLAALQLSEPALQTRSQAEVPGQGKPQPKVSLGVATSSKFVVLGQVQSNVRHETFDEEFRRRIIEAADNNTRQNENRSAYLYRARLALFSVLILAALAGIPFLVLGGWPRSPLLASKRAMTKVVYRCEACELELTTDNRLPNINKPCPDCQQALHIVYAEGVEAVDN